MFLMIILKVKSSWRTFCRPPAQSGFFLEISANVSLVRMIPRQIWPKYRQCFKMLMKHNCKTTAFPMKRQGNVSSPLVWGHSEKHGSGCSKFSQVLFSPMQQIHSLSLLLQRFSSLHHIPLRVFHYPEPDIFHGFWKPPLPHFCWRSWCTAASSLLFPI